MTATSSPSTRGLLPRPARGFTTGELIVAIVITAILLAAAVPTFTSTTNNVQIETARMTLGGILREARTLRAVNVADHTYTWEEAITDATADMGDQLEAAALSSVAAPVGVSASALASGYDGECMFSDGETFGSSWTFLCTPGEGTRVEDQTVRVDPTEWLVSVNPQSWDRVSLHRRHVVAWVDTLNPLADIVAQLAAVPDTWVYGRASAASIIPTEGTDPLGPVPTTAPPTTAPPTTEGDPGGGGAGRSSGGDTDGGGDDGTTSTTVPDGGADGGTDGGSDSDPGGDGSGGTSTTVPTTVTTTPEEAINDPIWPEDDDGEGDDELGPILDGEDPNPNPNEWWKDRTEGHCKKGGWAANYPAGLWKNQGDCVSFYATRGKNLPDGPNAHLYPVPPLDWHPSNGW